MPVDAKELMNWQERLSNTAHVREVADLKAAGLNPVLSAKLGGASTPSGGMDPVTSSASGGSGRGGYSAATGGIPNDGSIFGNLISNLDPNGTTQIGKYRFSNWLIIGVYQGLFGDGGSVSPDDVAAAVGDQTGTNVSGQQVISGISSTENRSNDYYVAPWSASYVPAWQNVEQVNPKMQRRKKAVDRYNSGYFDRMENIM